MSGNFIECRIREVCSDLSVEIPNSCMTHEVSPVRPQPIDGGTYGFCVRLSPVEFDALKTESLSKGTWRDNTVPLEGEIFPLYWGQDISPRSRLSSHLGATVKRTGALYLGSYETWKDKVFGYSVVLVADRKKVETELIKKYPPLLKCCQSRGVTTLKTTKTGFGRK
jgi:hypothetical protein